MESRSETQEADPSRRAILVATLLFAVTVPVFVLAGPSGARADDGEDDSGDDGGDDGDSGDDDSEDDGGDDGGDDGSGGGGSGGNSGSGSGSSGSGGDDSSGFRQGTLDQSDAARAVRLGQAIPLKDALRQVENAFGGQVIDVSLRSNGRHLEYRFKVRSDRGSVRTVRMDAGTGKFLGLGALFR